MKKLLKRYINSIFFIITIIGGLNAQLQVGDISPDFDVAVCDNGEDVNPDHVNGDTWSLHDEGAGKVTWINLFTSW